MTAEEILNRIEKFTEDLQMSWGSHVQLKNVINALRQEIAKDKAAKVKETEAEPSKEKAKK